MMPSVICECVALYDYQPDAENHLPLRAGDKVSVYIQEPSGWWNGFMDNGKNGWFPGAFVQVTSSPPAPSDGAASSSAGSSSGVDKNAAVTPPYSGSTSPIDSGASASVGDWNQHFTESGEPFYVHRVTGETSWTPSHEGSVNSAADDDAWDSAVVSTADEPSSQVSSSAAQAAAAEGLSARLANVRLSSAASRSQLSSHRLSVASTATTNVPSNSPQVLSFIDPNPSPVSEGGRYGYSNNFWSDRNDRSHASGFDVLVLKHRNGKEVCKDIAAFMHERAKIEENYANSILELAKMPLGDLESGTARTAWNQLKFDLKTQAKSRMEFVKELYKDVQDPIMNFKNEQKKMRKNYEKILADDRKQMTVKHGQVQKLRKIYIQRAKDAELADNHVSKGQISGMTRRDFDRVEEQAKRERKRASMAAYDYRTAVDDYERVRMQWEEDMHAATYEFQLAEEERLGFIKQVLQAYMKIQKEVNANCKESSEMVEESIEAVSKEVDIEMFVKQHFTGSHRPLPLMFEQYKQYC